MASEVDICNMALSHVGSDAVVVSISPADGSVESGYCARFFPIALGLLLERHTWSFAKTRVALAEVTNPSESWAYAYGLPGNCLKPRRVLQQVSLNVLGFYDFSGSLTADEYRVMDEMGSANFAIETDQTTGNKILLTNEPEAVLLYIRRVEDTTQLSYAVVNALSYLVAGFLAGPIIKGQAGVTAGQQLHAAVFNPGGLLDQAAASDADGSKETSDHIPAHIRAR